MLQNYCPPTRKAPETGGRPIDVFNIGNQHPVELLTYIDCIEQALGKKAEMNLLPLQPGDVPDTYAGVESLVEWVDYKPSVPVEEGVARFVEWYRGYYLPVSE